MNLKNYTSEINSDVTVARIERMLVSGGANGIQKLYDNSGNLTSLSFKFKMDGGDIPVKLPANVDACQESLWQNYLKNSLKGRKQREDFRDQATRTAWKLMQDWVEIQISLIHLKQLEPLQAFLAFIVTGCKGQTVFEVVQEQGYRSLLPEKT